MLAKDLIRYHRDELLDRLAHVYYQASRGLDKHLALSRLCAALKQNGVDVQRHMNSVMEACVNYAALAYSCPQFYGLDTFPEMLDNFFHCARSPWGALVLPLYAEAMECTGILEEVLDKLFADLMDITLGNLKPHTMHMAKTLINIPVVREKLVNRPWWLVDNSALAVNPGYMGPDGVGYPLGQGQGGGQNKGGFTFMVGTFLGRLLTPTPTDKAVVDELKQHLLPRAAMPGAQKVMQRAKQAVASHISQVVQLIKVLLKHGGFVREAVIRWFVHVLEANKNQTTVSFRHYQSQAPQLSRGTDLLACIVHKVCTQGFSFNVAWVMLELCRPIKIEKLADLDGVFPELCRLERDGGVLGLSCKDESKMGDVQELEAACKELIAGPAGQASSWGCKFTTQIFWLTFKASRFLLYQAFNEAYQKQVHLHKLVTEQDSNSGANADTSLAYSQVLIWQTCVRLDEFASAYLHFMDLLNGFVARAVFSYDHRGHNAVYEPAQLHPHPICKALNLPRSLQAPAQRSPQFMNIPISYFNDAYDAFSRYVSLNMSPMLVNQNSAVVDNAFGSTNCELFAIVLLFTLAGPEDFIRAAPLRLEVGGRCLAQLTDRLRDRFGQTYTAQIHLAAALCMAFVHAQKLSYYTRIDMRLVLTRELEILLNRPSFSDQLFDLSQEDSELYERFLHYFGSNTSYVLEEALTLLTEIKAREGKPEEPEPQVQLDANGLPIGEEEEEREFNQQTERMAQEIEGTRNVEELSFSQLSSQCQSLMDAGSASLNAFSRLDSRAFDFIRKSDALINPTVCCLNGCLNSLVGPKCMALKVSSFEKYKFRPRQFLADLIEIYVKLTGLPNLSKTPGQAPTPSQATSSQSATLDSAESITSDNLVLLIKAIKSDGRYYDQKTFEKAVRITRREGLASGPNLARFQQLVDALGGDNPNDDFLEELVMSGEVPEEYIDPLMSDVMMDPVQLPTSGVVVERKVIERHLLNDRFDPFNRAPLEKSQLVPQPELRDKIQQFIKQAVEKKAADKTTMTAVP
ncbi:putative ubiquitination factor [Gregarina niphandrodes]|uniref:RING-type E3 ubiquitin transferase n=1 Tax=Gregarina niphandrodes TaxID=110365 RepID=A0A023B0I4_GRENI|nr:putative ubiquitination factor [Gregarina niphandrodes]EZG45067.1 putative ubiquitination factor [Gregarina niphandrodes]|eukprot:XP_011132571.1 putative ubiquitination factor [Gregarina niphandrodes]